MATSSILENIKIDNPEFIKQFVEAMDTPANEKKEQRQLLPLLMQRKASGSVS